LTNGELNRPKRGTLQGKANRKVLANPEASKAHTMPGGVGTHVKIRSGFRESMFNNHDEDTAQNAEIGANGECLSKLKEVSLPIAFYRTRAFGRFISNRRRPIHP
jgi:hypothetical protein